ncbi:hypothetical protein Nepgr_023614 [Nepenthes gracilis]|uniref:Late embryogenesis abundant protein LEA-2 subgroup domain-containing protein n=1 Tax=Nepenthes gracilis TaxID=150966 RepID=A0AAD3T2V1_NEPGR|nr:hypothetical protein Nepgr_023614 [Nepenthes gracilis]
MKKKLPLLQKRASLVFEPSFLSSIPPLADFIPLFSLGNFVEHHICMAEESQPQEELQHHLPNMTEDKHTAHPHVHKRISPRTLRRGILAVITAFLLLTAIAAVVVWLIYRPQNPKFAVVSAAVYGLNTTAPPFLETSMQFTLLTRNPNRRVSLIYDRLTAAVQYRNQAITQPVELPPLFQERHSSVVMLLAMGGGMVPVSKEVMEGVAAEEAYGVVGLRLVVMGMVRYNAAAIRTRRYAVHVRCDVLVGLKRGYAGQVPLLANHGCVVDL